MAQSLADSLAGAGVDFVAAFPSSTMSPAQRRIGEDSRFMTVFPSNEGEGVAICAGAWMAGKKPAIIMENSGLSVVPYQIVRLNAAFEVPLLMVLDYRGDIGDGNWWAVPFGWSAEPLLDALRVPYVIAESVDEVPSSLQRLMRTTVHSKYPAALLLRYGMNVE